MTDVDPSATDYTKPPWGRFGRDFTFGFVSGFANVIVHVLNDFKVSNLPTFQKAVIEREEGTPLFTVSNHTR